MSTDSGKEWTHLGKLLARTIDTLLDDVRGFHNRCLQESVGTRPVHICRRIHGNPLHRFGPVPRTRHDATMLEPRQPCRRSILVPSLPCTLLNIALLSGYSRGAHMSVTNCLIPYALVGSRFRIRQGYSRKYSFS